MAMHTPTELWRLLDRLRDDVRREADEILGLWVGIVPDGLFSPSVRNLASYLALRLHDVSDLQPSLAAHGLSTLGRSEAHVMASLDALCATLAHIAGKQVEKYPPANLMASSDRALHDARILFFGHDVIGSSTRIMVTLPSEAASDRALVKNLIAAGMTCARINCAHDDAATWRNMAELVRAEAKAAGTECRILMDIGGPKCRVETVHASGKARLFRGDRIAMVREMANANAADDIIITVTFPEVLDQLRSGNEVWINDGKIGTRVASADGRRIELEVISARTKGEKLRPEKGLNFPDTELRLPPLMPKDVANLDSVVELADIIGFSFVQRPEDLTLLREELRTRLGGRTAMPIILKIETPLAVRNLPRLIVQAAAAGPVAVMIARGDLAVELGFARMAEIQEEIMWLCEAAHVPVVWATQVLDGLISDGIPSRAEATDAAMAQRAECVMLNKGPFLPEGMRFLADVLRRMDRHQAKKTARFGPLHSWPKHELGFTRA
jgi:pyruvate kinase